MRGDNHVLAITSTTDEVTGERVPIFAFPIQVCKATESPDDGSFEIAAPSGAKRKQVFVDEATGEIVENDACLRGIRVGDDFHEIPKDAIDAIAEQTKLNTMFVLGKVDLDTVFEQYGSRITGRYFIQSPAKIGSPKAYRLVYEALREQKTGKKVTRKAQAFVVKRTPRTRQKLGVLYADEQVGALVLIEVEFAANVREPDAQILAPQQAEVDADMLAKANEIVDALPDGQVALDTETDEAIALRIELRDKAIAGEAIAVPVSVDAPQGGDLTAMLTASVAAAR